MINQWCSQCAPVCIKYFTVHRQFCKKKKVFVCKKYLFDKNLKENILTFVVKFLNTLNTIVHLDYISINLKLNLKLKISSFNIL